MARKWGRVSFPLEAPGGELVGVYSRAVDPEYPERKAPVEVRHDVWGPRGLFNSSALAGPVLYLTEGCFDALAMLAAGYPMAAALVGTRGLRWSWLERVQEMYLCMDVEASGEGQEAAKELAREAVLRGLRVYTLGEGAYGGHEEPADQWEAEGRVTVGVCGGCGTLLYPPTAERCSECGAPMCPHCRQCDPSCPVMGAGG